MSESFNLSGYSVPNSKNTPDDVRIQNGNDKDNGNFVLDAVSFQNYLEDIEKPTLSFENLNSTKNISAAMNKINILGDFKGIITLTAGDRKEYDASGHVDLLYQDFTGDMSLYSSGLFGGGMDLDDYLEMNKDSNMSIKIWVINSGEDD